MSFDWSLFLSFAEKLVADEANEKTADEAILRIAISRAYYAVYHAAKKKVPKDKLPRPGHGDAHAAIWNAFKESPDKVLKKIGWDGNQLSKVRREADYEGHSKYCPSIRMTQQWMAIARATINRISECPAIE